MKSQWSNVQTFYTTYLYRQSCSVLSWSYRGWTPVESGSRVTSPESYRRLPFPPNRVATINLTIVKGQLIHATLLSIRYLRSRKRMNLHDFHRDPQHASPYSCNSHLSFRLIPLESLIFTTLCLSWIFHVERDISRPRERLINVSHTRTKISGITVIVSFNRFRGSIFWNKEPRVRIERR